MSAAATPIRVLAFDLDDTLYPEEEFVFSGFEAVADAHGAVTGLHTAARRLREIYQAGNRTRTFNQLLDELGIFNPEPKVRAMLNTYRGHAPRIHLYPDAEACLRRWASKVSLAIISDGHLQTQRNKLDALGLADLVPLIVLTDQWGREAWKPAARGFREVQARLGVSGGQCVYVGDNPAKDFVAPNRLGWRSVLLRRESGVYADAVAPEGGEPQHVIRHLDELDMLFASGAPPAG